MHFNKNLLFVLSFLVPLISFSQDKSIHLPAEILVNFEFGFNFPGGDYSTRFGNNLAAGGGVEYITKDGNLFLE